MKREELKIKFENYFYPILLYGTLWGIFEATAGYFLHLITYGIDWCFRYPIAFLFMIETYNRTEKINSIIFVALISASFKMLNLLLPIRIDYVINPVVSILIESIALCFVIKYAGDKNIVLKVLTANLIWRVLYLCYLMEMPYCIQNVSVLTDLRKTLFFLLTELLVTSIIILILLRVYCKIYSFLKSKLFTKRYDVLTLHNIDNDISYKLCIKKDASEKKVFKILSITLLIPINVLMQISL